ncbi:MAG: hypothetical protein SGILL_004422, partial [Bacillariaceae sp.]
DESTELEMAAVPMQDATATNLAQTMEDANMKDKHTNAAESSSDVVDDPPVVPEPDPWFEALKRMDPLNIPVQSPTSDQLEKYPVFAIEQLRKDKMHSKKRFNLNSEGGLFPGRPIERVHLVEFGEEGCYLGESFGSSPHYGVPVKDRQEFETAAEHLKIPCKHYPRTSCHTGKAFLQVYNKDANRSVEGMDSSNGIQDLLDQIPWEEALLEAIQNGQFNLNRNCLQRGFGFTSSQSQKRGKDNHTQPNFKGVGNCKGLGEGSLPTRINIILSKVAKQLYAMAEDGKVGEKGIFVDKERNEKWSCSERGFNHPEALLEALSISISIDGTVLTIHCDEENDESDDAMETGHNYTVCGWKTFVIDGHVIRMALLGYSRKSVPQAVGRKELYSSMFKSLKCFHDKLPVDQRSISSKLFFVTNDDYDSNGNLVRSPNLDKGVYFSSYGSFLVKVIDKIEKEKRSSVTLERVCELVLPIMMSPGPDIYEHIFTRWLEKELPPEDSNWALVFVEQAMVKFGTLGTTKYKRHQNTFNKSVFRSWFDKSLRCLLTAFRHARAKNSPPEHAKLVQQLVDGIDQMGVFLAGHVLAVAALCRIIPTRYALEAKIAPGTKTAKRLQQQYGLLPSQFDSFLKFVAKELQISKAKAENLICEWLKEDRSSFKKEVVFQNQTHLMQANESKNAYDVTCFERDPMKQKGGKKRGRSTSEPITKQRITSKRRLGVFSRSNHNSIYHWTDFDPKTNTGPPDPDQEIKVSRTSQLRNRPKKLRPKPLDRLRAAAPGFRPKHATRFGVDPTKLHRKKNGREYTTVEGELRFCDWRLLNEEIDSDSEKELHNIRLARAEERDNEISYGTWFRGGPWKDEEYGDAKSQIHLQTLHREGALKNGLERGCKGLSCPTLTLLYEHGVENFEKDPIALLRRAAGLTEDDKKLTFDTF